MCCTGLPPGPTGPVVGLLLNDRGLVRLPYHPLLVRTAAGLALIDTGAGPGLAEQSGEPVGRLPEALAAAGVAAEDVALVVLSHAHPDHIGGLTAGNGGGRRLVFPAPGTSSAGPSTSTGPLARCPAISPGWATWPGST
jgi:glyoxylase-like metal-dependent hydrolase (beta-lactamase superfamily II)